MSFLKIALLQISPTGTLTGNLNKGIAACNKAKKLGADVALFPEMWSNGYNIYNKQKNEWTKEAITSDCGFINEFSLLSRKLEMAIGITYLEKCGSSPKNSLILFDMKGNEVLHYSKVHTCDFGPERALTPGDDFFVTDLKTGCGHVKVGAMICYDREFPESARILMLKKAEVILVPNACPMEINRLSQLRARAYENMLGIATCNYPKNVPDCNGHSSAFDGVAYLPSLEGSRDTCIIEANEDEGIFIAEFDMGMIRDYRKTEVHGNSFRRPDKYELLTDRVAIDTFARKEYRF